MSKREKPAASSQDQAHKSSEEKTINDLIEKRKIQQEALKKIMHSIDLSEDKSIEKPSEGFEKRRTRIQKIFSTNKNIK